MNQNNNDSELIRVVFNPEGLVIWSGKPKKFSTKESKEYTKPGYEIKTMTFKEYQDAKYKWIWDKTQSHDQ